MRRDSEHHLRRFVACRDRGDAAGAAAAWEALVTGELDRVRDYVRVWGRDGRLDRDEQEEAISLAFRKLWQKMGGTFRGRFAGEFVNALVECTRYACLDVRRDAARRRRHEQADHVDAEGRSSTERAIEAQGLSDAEQQAAVDERVESLYRVLEHLRPEERLVLEHQRDGVPVEETCAALGVNPTALYTRRQRAYRAAATLWSDVA